MPFFQIVYIFHVARARFPLIRTIRTQEKRSDISQVQWPDFFQSAYCEINSNFARRFGRTLRTRRDTLENRICQKILAC